MLHNKEIILGVTGSIAAYKSVEILRALKKQGAEVTIVLTSHAQKFITPLTFQTLSGNPVYQDMFVLNADEMTGHISLVDWADSCVIAPLSANTLSKIACGICDNLLTTVLCAFDPKKKVVFAPAMNDNMWKNPIIRENVARLQKIKNYIILSPGRGFLACGTYGEGRMPEPEDIYKTIKKII